MAESETGIRLGKSLISGGQDFFMLSDSFSMVELPVPEEWTGITSRSWICGRNTVST